MKEKTKSAWKLTAGIALLVQSLTFIVVFLLLYKKKKSIAGTFLAIGAVGGIAGCVILMKEMKSKVAAKDRAAMDAFSFDEDDDVLFDSDDFCFSDHDCDEVVSDTKNDGEDVAVEGAV